MQSRKPVGLALLSRSPVLVPQFRDFILYLVKMEGLSQKEGVKGSVELLKYLNVCSLHPTLSPSLSPSLRVDKIWHALLQFPVLYSGICRVGCL